MKTKTAFVFLLLVGCAGKWAGYPSVDPDFVRANQLVQQGELPRALQHYEAALQRDSANPVYLYYYSIALAKSGDTSGALNALQSILENNPGDALAADMAGNLLLHQNRFAKALEVYKALGQANPDYESMAQVRRAEVFMRMSQRDSVFASASSALTKSPFSAEAWYLLGGFYASKNDPDQALRCLEKAFELEPSLKQQCKQDTVFNSLRDNPLFKWMLE